MPWKLRRSGSLERVDPQVFLADPRDLVDQFDCLYLALARREAASLLTADQPLQRLAAAVLP